MAGYMSGYLEALQVVSGVESQKQQRQMQQQQFQQRQREEQENLQERSILQDVFKQRAQTQETGNLADMNDQLAQQYRQAGQRLMGVNPQDAMRLLREGDQLNHQNTLTRLELGKTERLKGEYLASIASGVTDQESLDEYVSAAAKAGQVVPKKFQAWGEATQNYLERAVRASLPISKGMDLQLRTREAELRSTAEMRRQQDEERKSKNDAAREARLQQGLDIKKRAAGAKAEATLGLRGEKEVEGEIGILRDLDAEGAFTKAPSGAQRQAAQDVHYRAQKLYSDSLLGEMEPLSKEEALDLARQSVVKEFKVKEGGWFSKDSAERTKGGVEKKAVTGQPTVQEALRALGEEYNPTVYEYKIEGGKVLKRKK